MEDENFSNPTAEESEVETNTEETTVENPSGETTEEDLDIRYLNQKKRAEKAEAELKALKESTKMSEKPAKKEAQKNIINDRDETFIISALGSKGLSYDEINTYLDKVKKIAQVEDIPLPKVLDSEYFMAFDKSFQDRKKQELSSLSASKGSGGAASKKTLQTPGLSDDEFKKMLSSALRGQ